MTHPHMKSALPLPMARVAEQTHFRFPPRTASTAPRTPTLQAAASDEEPRKWYEVRNPLWVIAIGMAFLFAAMALIVALG
jgi:hypothetical protein